MAGLRALSSGSGLPVLVAGLLFGLDPRFARAEQHAETNPQPPPVDMDRVEAQYREGLAHYGARDYGAAAAAFSSAYALFPRADILFAWAQAERLRGNCAHARELFERFLAGGPPVQQVEAAELAMKRCEGARTIEVAPEPPIKATKEGGDVKPEASSTATRGRSLHEVLQDRSGLVLSTAGLFLLTSGASIMLAARAQAERAGTTPGGTLADTERRYDDARTRWRVGLGLTLFGGAALVTGGARYIWVAVRADGSLLSFGGRF